MESHYSNKALSLTGEMQHMIRCLPEIGEQHKGTHRKEALCTFFSAECAATGADCIFHYELINTDFFEIFMEYHKDSGLSPDPNSVIFTVSGIADWMDTFRLKKAIRLTEKDPTEAWLPAKSLISSSCRSLIAFPFFHDSDCIGFAILENPDNDRAEAFLSLTPLIGAYFGSVRSNYRKNDMLEKHVETLTRSQAALKRERQFLDVLYRDYTSAYYVDLTKDSFEPLKIDSSSNAALILASESRERIRSFSRMVRKYCADYIPPHHQEKFLSMFDTPFLMEELKKKERLSFRYHSIPNLLGRQYFEAQIVRISDPGFDGRVLIGFHHIDEILAAEQKQQRELEEALENERLGNETLSALGKIYFSIFRIDLEQDLYEEISSDREVHHLTGKSGCASTEMVELCNRFVVPAYRTQIMQFFDLSTLADRLHEEETVANEYLATDGNWHTARFIVKRRNESGRVTHVLYVTRLISDSKRREQNWISIAEEANQANSAKTEFISQIAHDIRTPLNAILGFLTIAETHPEDAERIRYDLGKLRVAGEFLQELVDDVLDISRIEGGRMKLQPEKLELKRFFYEFPTAFEHAMLGKSLHFDCHVHDLLHDCILADALRLKQVYSNLLSNAVKYTPDGGRISLEAYEEPLPEDGLVRLVVVISDTGIGMSKDFMKTMYLKFSRGTDTRINKVSGYGLGLSIVKQLTDLMNGTIDVESEPMKGTTFRIAFPFPYADSEEGSFAKRTIEEDAKLCRGMHLLVAEDNELNYEVLCDLLKMHGITCDWAIDGAVCVEMLRTAAPHTYDAILMDMQMPNMNGIEAATAIRKLLLPEAHTIPIIAMTANAFREDIQKCLEAGMNTHMSKPVDLELLLRELARLKKSFL